MKNLHKISLINLFLFCFSPLVFSEEAPKNTNSDNNNKIIIKLTPGYKKTDLTNPIQDNYKRTIIIDIADKTDLDELRKIGEERCREYAPQQRQNYFVNLVKGYSKKAQLIVPCSEVDGPIIEKKEGANKNTAKIIVH